MYIFSLISLTVIFFIGDFGTVFHTDVQNMSKSKPVGTLIYSAPEIFLGLEFVSKSISLIVFTLFIHLLYIYILKFSLYYNKFNKILFIVFSYYFRYTSKVDVFSLGVIAYEMITFKHPYPNGCLSLSRKCKKYLSQSTTCSSSSDNNVSLPSSSLYIPEKDSLYPFPSHTDNIVYFQQDNPETILSFPDTISSEFVLLIKAMLSLV